MSLLMNYSDDAVSTALTSAITSTTATSIQVGSVTGFPQVYPYRLTIDPGQSGKEHVRVTAPPTGTGPYTLTVARGSGGSVPATHAVNAVVQHMVVAQDLRDMQARSHPAVENYLLGWTFPFVTAPASVAPTVSEVYMQRVNIEATGTINYIYAFATSPGVTMTAGQNFVGLYDLGGNRVATSADCATLWQSPNVGAGGSHVVKIPLTAGYAVMSGDAYYVAMLLNGATMPSLACGGLGYFDLADMGGGVPNWATAAAPYNVNAPNRWKYMSWSVGVSALPSTIDLDYGNPDKAFALGVGQA